MDRAAKMLLIFAALALVVVIMFEKNKGLIAIKNAIIPDNDDLIIGESNTTLNPIGRAMLTYNQPWFFTQPVQTQLPAIAATAPVADGCFACGG